MKYALVNPNWTFNGSIYFGCREPHLPLEYGYAKALLERAGHQAILVDGQLDGLPNAAIRETVAAYQPDFTVITSAPSYLFWRCAPPELRVPQETVATLREVGGTLVIVGPHASTTPATTLRKTGADAVIIGECEEILPLMAAQPWRDIPSVGYWDQGKPHVAGGNFPLRASADMSSLPALHWPASTISNHHHHHHRFEAPAVGPGAEMETSRGCPYHCSFCAKDNFRNKYRKRPVSIILEELDGLLAQGVQYIYFIDEIFLPNRELLEALVQRSLKFGVQTRIDLWDEVLLDLLGQAGCVSIEAGIESITAEGRALLDKNCKLSTDELSERLIYAKQRVPFVQANLIDAKVDEQDAIEAWRAHLQTHGVWANKPVPLFPYPGSPDYGKLWGTPDEAAWERAHQHYLQVYAAFSDIQDEHILPLAQLELYHA